MKRFIPLLLAGFAVLCAPSPAAAADELSEVTTGLQQSSVYVAPEVNGTDTNTAATLAGRLNGTDGIVIVILPDGSVSGDLTQFAVSIDDSLDGPQIIGLSVGDQSIGYAANLPSGTAADLMNRADSVSNGPLDTMGTYIRNVHSYQSAHPEAVPPSPSQPAASDDGIPVILFVVVAIVATVALVVVKRFTRLFGGGTNEDRKRFKAPGDISDLLADIADIREDVASSDLRSQIYQCCEDIEAYFRRKSSDKEHDTEIFKRHLVKLRDVLKKYVDIQQNQRYFNDPRGLMRQGESAVEDFSQFVLDSHQRGNKADLVDYRVSTDILKAQRFR